MGLSCKADFNTERKKISEQTDKERENLFYQIKETMNGIYKQADGIQKAICLERMASM